MQLEGRRWWPQPWFGSRAALVCWGSASGGDTMSCPDGSVFVLKTKMLPLFRAAAVRNLF